MFLFVTDYAGCWIKCGVISKCILLGEVSVNSFAHYNLIPSAHKNVMMLIVVT